VNGTETAAVAEERPSPSFILFYFRSKFETKTKYSLNWNFRVFWPNTPIGTYHHAVWLFWLPYRGTVFVLRTL